MKTDSGQLQFESLLKSDWLTTALKFENKHSAHAQSQSPTVGVFGADQKKSGLKEEIVPSRMKKETRKHKKDKTMTESSFASLCNYSTLKVIK